MRYEHSQCHHGWLYRLGAVSINIETWRHIYVMTERRLSELIYNS